jgi:hypothetical protein
MKNLYLALLVVLTTTVITGCALYFGDGHRDDVWTYCGADGYYHCEDNDCRWVSATCPSGGGGGSGGGGFECRDNDDCAAGCYCDNGLCEEAGFCTKDSDCGTGFTCNEERSSCEPGGCKVDSDCEAGSVCTNGSCTATCVCASDAEAVAQGYAYCDELRITCMDGADPAGTCAAQPPSCNQLPPACAPGDVPLLGADGCWNGQCQGASDCATPPACQYLNTAASCTGRSDCEQVVNGINCKKTDGSACQAGDTGCTCESYVFASCRVK